MRKNHSFPHIEGLEQRRLLAAILGDIEPGPGSSDAANFVEVDGQVVFTADGAVWASSGAPNSARMLFTSDAVDGGEVIDLIADENRIFMIVNVFGGGQPALSRTP